MLIESAVFAPARSTDGPSVASAVDATTPAEGAAAPADRMATIERVSRALEAIEALARTRRSRELVLALERLGAGLDATIEALDDAIEPRVAPGVASPVPVPATWGPISKPLVPITAHVADPRSAAGPDVPSVVGPVPSRHETPAALADEPAVVRPMRQAPAGLAAHVIDFTA